MKLNRKAFTLIELLAVILILGIIALIAIPTVTSIIEDAKMQSSIRTVENYVEAVNNLTMTSALKSNSLENGRYFISEDGNLMKNGIVYNIDIKGNKPNTGALTIDDDEVINGSVTIGNFIVSYDSDGKLKVVKSDSSKVYGLEYDITNKVYTRLNDAEGLTACVGTNTETCINDFDSAEIYKDMVEEVDTYGNVFIKIPKFYIKKEVSETRLAWYISKTKEAGYYLPNCFYDKTNNVEKDYVLVGKYDASRKGSKLQSKSKATPIVLDGLASLRYSATANNINGLTGYQQMDIHIWDMLQTLFYIEFGTLDSQSIMKGFSSGVSPWQNTYKPLVNINNSNYLTLTVEQASEFKIGQRIDISTWQGGRQIAKDRTITNIDYTTGTITFDGEPVNITTSQIVSNCSNANGQTDNILTSSGSSIDNTSGKYSMSYRGIENLYGNIGQFVDGIIKDNESDGTGYIYVNEKPLKYSDYSSSSIGADYKKVTSYGKQGVTTNWTTSIINVGYDSDYPFVQIPITVSSSYSDSFYKDYYYQNNVVEKKYLYVGGYWASNRGSGISYFNFSIGLNYVELSTGCRLVKTLK